MTETRYVKKYGGKINTTSCDPYQLCFERGCIHRDYLSHYLRWCFLGKLVKRGSKILDVGAGKGRLGLTLYRNRLKPERYDVIEIHTPYIPELIKLKDTVNFPMEIYEHDIRSLPWPCTHNYYDIVAIFEVVEHIEEEFLPNVLYGLIDSVSPDGRVLLSTPNYDPKVGKAKNHIKEYTEEELEDHLKSSGFIIEKKYGTFMSLGRPSQAKKILTPEEYKVFEGLYPYYNASILSILFAPLHPSESRNILWVLRK